MGTTIGDYEEFDADRAMENLSLRFSPSSIPLKQRWRNNGLSADFLADYVTTFFPKVEDDPATHQRASEIKGAVSYIANELLENAMKYSQEGLPYPILIQLQLEGDRIIFSETNTVSAGHAERFRAHVAVLAASDPAEAYMRQLESGGQGGSGLGLVTMAHDYGARLAWRFEAVGNDAVTVTTQVQLAI